MDSELIRDIQQGSEAAFKQLYDLYNERIYFYFLKKTGSKEVCRELVQTTFIKCWRYRDSLKKDLSLSCQLFHIARTTLVDILRQKAANRTVAIEKDYIAEIPSPSFYESEKLAMVTTQLCHLPPVRRKIFEYRLKGLSNKEIAELLAISKKTVENQLNRAIREIRKHVTTRTPLIVLLLIL